MVHEHWREVHLHDFLLARAAVPFAWGTNDCATFAADGVLAVTGVDIAAPFRGMYTDEAGAMAAVHSVCDGNSVAEAAAWCAAQHGMPERLHPLTAQRGEMVIVETPGSGEMTGLVHLTGVHVVVPGEKGLRRLPITAVRRAWAYRPEGVAIV